jgi:hypothetical protein
MARGLLAILLIFLCVSPAFAADARISNLSATVHQGAVSVSFVLANAFDRDEIANALESGLPTGFTYHVQLIRKRENWFDNTLQTARIEVVCTYNSVTREYLLNHRRDRRLVHSEVFNDIESLRRRMTTIVEQDLFTTDRDPRRLRVRVRADLMRGYLLYVVPWDVSTNWTVTRVTAGTGRSQNGRR